LQRRATERQELLVVPDQNTANTSEAVQSETRGMLGILPANTFTSARYRRQVTIHSNEPQRWGVILPVTIEAKIHLRFHGVEEVIERAKVIPRFVWYLTDSYRGLVSRDDIAVPEHHTPYMRHACFYVVHKPKIAQDVYYSVIDDDEPSTLRDYAQRDICHFIGLYPSQPFTLDIYWDYSSIQVEPISTPSMGKPTRYADLIQAQLDKKVIRNFQGQDYISNCDLNPFLVLEVTTRLIHDDLELSELGHFHMSHEQKADFANKVHSDHAVKLQAICVYAGLDMSFLRHLMEDHKFSDKIESLPRPVGHCRLNICAGKIKRFLDHMPKFFARNIDNDNSLHELGPTVVMPLYHVGPSGEKKVLGQGGFGSVYEVGIDPAHTSLSGVSHGHPCLSQNNSSLSISHFEGYHDPFCSQRIPE
jgi:hypothetical protein